MKRGDDGSARALLERLPDVVDEVAVRRLRGRVLDAAAEALRPRPPTLGSRRAKTLGRLGAGAVVAVAVALAAAPSIDRWVRGRGVEAAWARVVAADAAPITWSRRREGSTEWIDLRDGAFRLEMLGRPADARVVVRVPDGRIDDLGTIFDVVVENGHTSRVYVETGHVQLWLAPAPGVVLSSGEAWEHVAAPAAPATAAGVAAAPATPPPPTRASVPSADDGGRSEDAAYLRVLRLLRASRPDDAREAARAYLRRFPNGFRRDELRQIAR